MAKRETSQDAERLSSLLEGATIAKLPKIEGQEERMETGEHAAAPLPSEVWKIIFDGYLSQIDKIRCRRVSRSFERHAMEALKSIAVDEDTLKFDLQRCGLAPKSLALVLTKLVEHYGGGMKKLQIVEPSSSEVDLKPVFVLLTVHTPNLEHLAWNVFGSLDSRLLNKLGAFTAATLTDLDFRCGEAKGAAQFPMSSLLNFPSLVRLHSLLGEGDETIREHLGDFYRKFLKEKLTSMELIGSFSPRPDLLKFMFEEIGSYAIPAVANLRVGGIGTAPIWNPALLAQYCRYFPRIESFEMSGFMRPISDLQFFDHLPVSLKRLKLWECELGLQGMSTDEIWKFAKFRQLESLNLNHTSFADYTFLSSYPRLKEFVYDNTRVPLSLENFEKIPIAAPLESVDLYHRDDAVFEGVMRCLLVRKCRLRSLSLRSTSSNHSYSSDGSDVFDPSLLMRLITGSVSTLDTLVLNTFTRLDDIILRFLAETPECRRLKTLNLWGTSVSVEGVRQFLVTRLSALEAGHALPMLTITVDAEIHKSEGMGKLLVDAFTRLGGAAAIPTRSGL